jgi:hypothetical protein
MRGSAHVFCDVDKFEMQLFIDGVEKELREAIASGIFEEDGPQTDDVEFSIKVGPRTMVALWAAGKIQYQMLDAQNTTTTPNPTVTIDDEVTTLTDSALTKIDGVQMEIDGVSYTFPVLLEVGFDGAAGMIGDQMLWQYKSAA